MSFAARKAAQGNFSVRADDAILQCLTDDGLEDGDPSITGDYSVTPADFYIEAQAGYQYTIYQLKVTILGASAGITPVKYGDIAALTNGISLVVEDDSAVQVKDLTPAFNIKQNIHWNCLAADGEFAMYSGANDVLTQTLRFFTPIVLLEGWSLRAELSDDLSAISMQTIAVGGHRLAVS